MFPFLFFAHGETLLDSKLKYAETFLVFGREVLSEERAALEAGCPRALAGSFRWTPRVVRFGSGGDTFDVDVLAEFGDGKGKRTRSLKKLEPAFRAFEKAFDSWLLAVHARAPIAFVWAPTSTEHDDDAWALFSEAHVDDALDVMHALRTSGGAAPLDLAHIESFLLPLLSTAPPAPERLAGRLAWIGLRLAQLDTPIAIEPRSFPEHDIHDSGRALDAVLHPLSPEARAAAIDALPPRARLLYLASFAALHAGDLRRVPDLVATTCALVDASGEDGRWRASSLMGLVGENLAGSAPVAALTLLRAAIARGSRHARTYAAALHLAKELGDAATFEALADEGVRATRAVDLAQKIVEGSSDERWSGLLSQLRLASTAAQSRDLGRMARAFEATLQTPDLLGNHALFLAQTNPAAEVARSVAARIEELLLAEPSLGGNVSLALNYCILAGNTGQGDRAIDVLERLFSRGLPLTDQLGLSLSYAASVSRSDEHRRRVLSRFEASFDPASVDPLSFENLAEIHVALGDLPRALDALRSAKHHGHPNFASLRTSAPLAPLHHDAAFVALFR